MYITNTMWKVDFTNEIEIQAGKDGALRGAEPLWITEDVLLAMLVALRESRQRAEKYQCQV